MNLKSTQTKGLLIFASILLSLATNAEMTAQDGMNRLKTNIENCEYNEKEYKSNLDIIHKNSENLNQAKSNIDTQKNEIKKLIKTNLQNSLTLDRKQKEVTGLIQSEDKEIKNEEQKIRQLEQAIAQLKQNQTKRTENIAKYKEQIVQIQNEKGQWQQRQNILNDRQKQIFDKLAQVKSQQNDTNKKKKSYEKELSKWQKEKDKQQKSYDQFVALTEGK